jgi:prophage regulatory protein
VFVTVHDARESIIGMDHQDTTRKAIRLPAVCEITGLTPRQVYRLANAGTFPKPKKPSKRVSLWFTDELQQWLDSLPKAVFLQDVKEQDHE